LPFCNTGGDVRTPDDDALLGLARIPDRYDELRLVELRALLDRLPPDRRRDVVGSIAELTSASCADPAGVR
jgi:hypothetical protein